ncbi:subtilisin family serine protease [Sinorhizobium medicae]|uniref:S8 family serine peptidase n=1 Tax=Sinorhizobium medicae TaxID=110321 RepID=UPI00119BC889|nr:S8 family serine peptidase [Sinorhizobium medicae]MDX0439618.1 S8 family serine peptidase [Sinorhizobium medicae]MDX0913445.1 S8 family serine peptidase [Sinorhizobium medicae]MDX1091488.1 S8 family serine peptidase [Sinorhizobium medicae]MDX1116243.1 S8 family serine peptidase [Sinorhizobium medicae]MQU73989.1 S8 family serine peptidase [Sinorhizobium medicae]
MAARNLAKGSELLLETGVDAKGLGFAGSEPAQWVRVNTADNPWDHAHAMMRAGFAAGSGDLLAAEPEFEQQWTVEPQASGKGLIDPQSGKGGRAVGPHDRWHLDAQFSGLADARSAVSDHAQRQVLIAHVDTGYDPGHHFRPARVETQDERNFVKGEGDARSARDVTPNGVMNNPGHGTGTIGILSGPEIGGAPGARVLPIRIADSVVRFRTGTMAQGFDYALSKGTHVLSMSMGGLASAILADAVNKCYDGGLVMVTAAGNNYDGLPVRSIVYPARMRRVVAACGIMANLKAYAGLDTGTMEGCYGPPSKMLTALSGFTPNIPWPEIGHPDVVDQDGQGTSAATPQVAAAAALWIAKYMPQLESLPENWMRGEAVRQALFRSASLGGRSKPDPKLGWGAVKAVELLSQVPLGVHQLTAAPPASASWAWLKLFSGEGVGLAVSCADAANRLLGLELAQLAQRDPQVAQVIADPDADQVQKSDIRRCLEAAEASPLASKPLKHALAGSLAGRRKTLTSPSARPSPASGPIATAPSLVKAPERRRLRIFAVDPSLGGSLNSYEDQIATIDVRNEPDLAPGPVGEYLEVVDVDPASDRAYPPVNLNDPNLLLQDGATPSEGNPAFHQQMTYAVAMRTIEHFELALGRKALWAPKNWSGKVGEPNLFVRRLRIYPHALRQQNAYYSPDHIALMFGYFPANSRVSDLTPPGTMVFTCLSADIIAHETTHALLDGQARTMREPSNPDVRAFHEAFADIVALFQQFTYHDLVRREIARARTNLSAASMLGKLASQFGEGTGLGGALRRYPDLPPKITYATTFATHARGSLLVAAVYQAFLGIVERRTGDFIRLATGGTGVLPEGAINPGLVSRLTDETCKAAAHVLKICIRAIDYCPPVDITFGEYLRAIITADLDEMPEDRYGYRVAFLEAFRKRQLLPRSLRTVSVDTLCWRQWEGPQPAWLAPAIKQLDIDVTASFSREEIFTLSEERREKLRASIEKGLNSQEDCDRLGLQYKLPYFASLVSNGYSRGTTFMVDNVRVAKRVREDGDLNAQLIVVVRQRRPESLAVAASDDQSQMFWFRGGATLIIDLLGKNGPRIRYAILKPIVSPSRVARERSYKLGDVSDTLRSMYFGGNDFAIREPFAIIHQSRDEDEQSDN